MTMTDGKVQQATITTNPTNNVPSSSNVHNASNSDGETNLNNHIVPLWTCIGTGIFIAACILILRRRFGTKSSSKIIKTT